MLKGVVTSGLAAKQVVRSSPLVAARAPVSRQRQAFKAAKRSFVVKAAEGDAPSAKPQKISLASLSEGQEFEGTVTKVEAFGAFVDIGADRTGLVHISQLSDGFVKSASDVVAPNQRVRVRVMSVDAGSNRIALSMKGLSGAGSEEGSQDEEVAEDFDDYEEGVEEEEEGEELYLEAEEGHELVVADEEPDMVFQLADEDEDGEMTVDAIAAFEALDPEQIQREIKFEELPIPLGELVSGKVTRVEDFGAFVEFEYNGRRLSALLERDEAKVPASALSPEQQAEFAVDGEVPDYVDMDIESNMSSYYQPGDAVEAFVLNYEDGKLSLTQWADWEVEAAGQELELEDEEEAGTAVDEEADPFAEDPLSYLEEDFTEEDVEADMAELHTVEQGAASMGEMRADAKIVTGMPRRLENADVNMTFPSRPLKKVNVKAFDQLGFTDTDFDGDAIELQDYWTESFQVPKDAMKRMGLRFQLTEEGDVQIVEYKDATPEEIDIESVFQRSHEDRVAAFVKDLLAADEDEAEIPARAMRKPVVLAASVQNISAATVKDLRTKTGAGMMDCKKALAENDCDVEKAIEWLRKKGLAGADKKAGRVAAEGVIARYIHPGSRLGVLLEVNCETDFVAASDKFQSLVGEIGMIIASCPEVICVSADDVPAEVLAKEREVEMGKEDIKSKPEAVRAKIVEGRLQKARDNMSLMHQASLRDPNKTVQEIVKESIAAIGENIQVRRFIRFNLGEGLEKKKNDFAAEVAQQTQAKAAAPAPAAPKEEPKKEEAAKPTVQVSASTVKELRDKTGAGMMDCKKALAENNGDMEASIEWLRKKGLAGADKKAGRVAAEGAVAAYIHPGSRLGVLLEVNCETDFVAASDPFNALVNNIAMQIAASPTVQYVSAEDIPADVWAREKEIEMGREDLKGKPDAIRAKIAEGRVAKLAQEMALLPQPYLLDPSKTVEQAVKEAIASIGEKISVRRFVKFQLGEGIEKKVSNLAEEVAAATGQA